METGFKSAIVLILFYLAWTYLMPYLRKKKAEFVKKSEDSIERRGYFRHYKILYKAIKTLLYMVLALLILLPVLFFLIILISVR